MGVARNRRKIRLSKLYSYACFRPSEEGKKSNGEGDGLPFPAGGPGFSRLVFCNHPHKHLTKPYNYGSNYVSTTKYNLLTFFPKSLFEQFRRVANLYFLFAAILSLTSLAPFKASTLIFPLIFVVGISMLKEVIEDTRRFLQDREVNARKVKRHAGEGAFEDTEWQKLHVGDVVMVEKDHFFPADLLLLSSSYPDGICYIETMNLDGETNLKLKKAKEDTLSLDDDFEFRSFKGSIRCEDPNPNLYTFVGSLDYQEFTYSLGPQQILLRDSKLRNTQFIYGVVIFTGHDTKVVQNATDPPSKRSRVEKKLDSIIYLLFSALLAISVIGSIVYGILNEYDAPSWWYLQDHTTSDNPSDPFIASLLHLLTALILYGYLIPISLYVSIEIVKVLQSLFINQDVKMYYKEADKPAQARTSNLNEELGQVDTILTDKTGTLTCNQMDFVKCSIAGVSYGLGITEIAIAKKMQKDPQVDEATFKALELDLNVVDRDDKELTEFPLLKGFNFRDSRLMNGNWMLEADADVIATFFRILAICHTAIPEDEESDQINYEAESPDEGAFVVAAREFGFEFCKRTQTSVYIREPDCSTDNKITREYKILNLLEFNSTRKRMSVIIRDEKGQVFILCKGADSVILERLGKIGTKYEVQTRKDITTYGEAGLRTLALAYRKLEEAEYAEWNKLFLKAKTMVGASRDAELDAAAEMIEKDLILVGATAVEDKLQKGVPECIDKLAFAGIKIWVLTGDKMETAINIGFSCNLLRQGMQQIFLTLDTESVQEAESQGDKDIIAKVSFMTILQQVSSAQNQIIMETSPDAVFALIIDGKALTYALQENLKKQFLQLAVNCAAVVCCRVSPKQKALVTRLVKEGTNRNTLAIGDGANDVGMIQEADIGVGISGVEGMQAVMASDFSIAQFCFLERLLIVHGHWCYRRISTMICLFFYKNITFGLTLFCYEAYTSFSAQTAYNDWSMSFFNVLFTSLPVLSLGVFEQDVAADICLAFPTLYQQGPRNMLFGWDRILTWMGNGIYSAFTIFFFTNAISQHQSFRNDGHVPGLEEFGSMMYSCVVLTINLQIALATSHFTRIQHICIWGSICLWYIFLVVYGFISPLLSTTAYKVFVEALAPAPMYWYTIIFAPLVCILPYFTISALQKAFCPMDHHIIQEIRHMKKDLECSTMWSKYKANAAQKTAIGFTA